MKNFINDLAARFRAGKLTEPVLDTGFLETSRLTPYDGVTTKEDILSCFRLVLGRNPNPEEWIGHMMHIGDPLPGVVASYTRSLEFARRGLNNDMPGEIVLSDFPGFRIYSDSNDGAVGKYIRQGAYEPEVGAVFNRLLKQGMGVLDIGANVGYFSLLSAVAVGKSGHVFAIEPNQENAKLLEASRRLNQFEQISVLPVAAGAENGSLALHSSHSTGTTSALPTDLAALLSARLVPCMKLDDIIMPTKKIDLIKIDVDGAEFLAMSGCEQIIRRDRPAIISEFAPNLLPGISGISGEEYLGWFIARKYNIAVIQPDGSLHEAGSDVSRIMEAFQQRGTDHIDILATVTTV